MCRKFSGSARIIASCATNRSRFASTYRSTTRKQFASNYSYLLLQQYVRSPLAPPSASDSRPPIAAKRSGRVRSGRVHCLLRHHPEPIRVHLSQQPPVSDSRPPIASCATTRRRFASTYRTKCEWKSLRLFANYAKCPLQSKKGTT